MACVAATRRCSPSSPRSSAATQAAANRCPPSTPASAHPGIPSQCVGPPSACQSERSISHLSSDRPAGRGGPAGASPWNAASLPALPASTASNGVVRPVLPPSVHVPSQVRLPQRGQAPSVVTKAGPCGPALLGIVSPCEPIPDPGCPTEGRRLTAIAADVRRCAPSSPRASAAVHASVNLCQPTIHPWSIVHVSSQPA